MCLCKQPVFLGLLSNLSTSFTKFRSTKHNASTVSERSVYSMASFMDKSATGASGGANEKLQLDDTMTPKVRKRKMEDDSVPFSASKK